MTGKGHTWVALATSIATYKFSSDLGLTGYLAVIAYIFGGTAPDWMEIRVKSGDGVKTLIKHRTITHWLPMWIAIFVIAYGTVTKQFNIGLNIHEYVLELILGFSMGALLHLLTDLPNPQGIPIIFPSGRSRFSLNLWKSGKYEVAITIVGLSLALWYVDLLKFNYYALEKL